MCVPCHRLFGLHMMALQWLGSLSTRKDTPPQKGSITLPPYSMVRSSSCKAFTIASSCFSLSCHPVEAFLSSKLRCQAQNKRHRLKGTTCIVIECMAITLLLHIALSRDVQACLYTLLCNVLALPQKDSKQPYRHRTRAYRQRRPCSTSESTFCCVHRWGLNSSGCHFFTRLLLGTGGKQVILYGGEGHEMIDGAGGQPPNVYTLDIGNLTWHRRSTSCVGADGSPGVRSLHIVTVSPCTSVMCNEVATP